ncbi:MULTISPECIES: acyltransferase family protein [unclassified Blastococcus]
MATGTYASRRAVTPPRDPGLTGLPRDGAHHVRGDIEGLRAVAVLLVIGDHLFGRPVGGFVGVDVFFVISGFLITGLLLREHRTANRISFADFYRRRIRRILPAALLVLGATSVAASVVFFGSRARETLDDALWSALFAGNWHFALDGTDYLQAEGPVSPLRHFWSLSVEEQFYFFWPAVMAVVLAAAGWRRRHRRKGLKAITATMLLLVAASFWWALQETTTEPTWAYFSTFSRAWELGVGALVAIAAPALARIPARLRPPLGWAGLAGIALSAFVIDQGTPFPAPGAVLPVLATALVIAAGTGGATYLAPLTNPLARYVGGLSYSLYLWHFPVIVVLAALVPVDATYYALVLAITAVASMASYHLVEQPIRRSDWLRPGAARRPRDARGRRAGAWAAAAAVAGVAALALVAGQAVGWPGGRDAGAQTPPPAPVVAAPDAADAPDPEAVLAEEITAALGTTEWPELTPSLDALGPAATAPEWTEDGCLNVLADIDACRFGDPAAPRTAVLLGDSVGISWMPGVRQALGEDWQVQSLTLGQCPQVDVPVRAATGIDGWEEVCAEHRAWAVAQLQLLQPELVVVASAANSIGRLDSEATGEAALAEWRAGVASMLATLDTAPVRVVLLGSPPGGENLQDCATRFNGPQDCVSSPPAGFDDFVEAERQAVAAYRPAALQAAWVDTRPWFCDAADRCPPFVGTVPVFADGLHLSAAYSTRLAAVLAPVLLG